MAEEPKVGIGKGTPIDVGVALSRKHDTVNCEACAGEWEEALRDKRRLQRGEDLNFELYQPDTVPPHVFQPDALDNCRWCGLSRDCYAHQPDGTWCPGCQGQHGGTLPCVCGTEEHNTPESEQVLCDFPTLAAYQEANGAHPQPSSQEEQVQSTPDITPQPNIAVHSAAFNPQTRSFAVEVCTNFKDGDCGCPVPEGVELPEGETHWHGSHVTYSYQVNSAEEMEAYVQHALEQAHISAAVAEAITLDPAQFAGKTL